MKFELHQENDLVSVVEEIMNKIAAVLGEQAVILALSGPLGVGKTAFTKVLGEKLGIDPEQIVSPSFVLHVPHLIKKLDASNKAQIKPQVFLQHIDCWRMENFEELIRLGLEKMIENKDVMVIEWADKFEIELKSFGVGECKTVWIKLEYGEKDEERRVWVEETG